MPGEDQEQHGTFKLDGRSNLETKDTREMRGEDEFFV